VFASDAAALAAAEKTYKGYNSTSDAIGRDGGLDPQRVSKWVSADWLPNEIKGAASLAAQHEHLVGTTEYRSFTLQQLEQTHGGRVEIDVYVCVDVSGTRLLDASGNDMTSPSRPDIVPLQIQFKNISAGSRVLVLSESEPWSGQNFCL